MLLGYESASRQSSSLLLASHCVHFLLHIVVANLCEVMLDHSGDDSPLPGTLNACQLVLSLAPC